MNAIWMISRWNGSCGRRVRAHATIGRALLLSVNLAAIGALCLSASTALAAGLNRPTVKSLTLSPTSLSHAGGTTRLQAAVKHATSCRISITPRLAGLPKTRSCSSGHLVVSFHVGANPSAAPRQFTVTLKAVKSGHHVTKSVHLKLTGMQPSITSFSASPAGLPTAGGVTNLTAGVSDASTCQLSASPAVTGLPAAVPCSGTSYSQQVTLPANTSTAVVSYSFTLQVTGPGGSSTVSTHPVVTVAGFAPQPPGGCNPLPHYPLPEMACPGDRRASTKAETT